MGMPGPWELLIILGIVALVFGTSKLRNLGSDVGSIVKGYQKAMKGEDDNTDTSESSQSAGSDVIEGEVEKPGDKQA